MPETKSERYKRHLVKKSPVLQALGYPTRSMLLRTLSDTFCQMWHVYSAVWQAAGSDWPAQTVCLSPPPWPVRSSWQLEIGHGGNWHYGNRHFFSFWRAFTTTPKALSGGLEDQTIFIITLRCCCLLPVTDVEEPFPKATWYIILQKIEYRSR